jgi:hypothetical protein
MDEIPKTPPTTPQAAPASVSAPVSIPAPAPDSACQCGNLQSQIAAILVILIIISGTLTGLLYRLAKYTRQDLALNSGDASRVLSEYATNSGPELDRVVKALTEFGATHSDFQPILNHYGITNAPAAAAPPK